MRRVVVRHELRVVLAHGEAVAPERESAHGDVFLVGVVLRLWSAKRARH